MSMNTRSRKNNKSSKEPAYIYLNSISRNRFTSNNAPLRNRNNYDALKTLNRKSIEINPAKHVTIQAQPRNCYKRTTQFIRRKSQNRRYEDEDSRDVNKSPYLKRDYQGGKTSSLSRQSNKIRSGHFLKSVNNQLYKQPRSSLSQHYDPYESTMHKRRVSVAHNDRNYVIEQAKQFYKNNQFERSIDILRRYIKHNQNSTDAHYFLGMSLINNNEFNLGIQSLCETLKINPQYKKNLYLVIALALKKLNKLEEAIDILTKGLESFPDYYDCLVYRGKMNLKKQEYPKANEDFRKAITLNPNKGFAFLGQGTVLKQLNQVQQAIDVFTRGIATDMKQACLEKRGLCYFDLGKFELAIADFERCSQVSQHSSLNYLKGITYYNLKKPMQAILCFEQSLKHDTNQENVTSSVEMMIKIKVEDKDFYEAYHILNRTANFQINKEVIEQWRLFLEGSLFMMKKKYKEGVSTLNSLLSLPFYRIKYQQIKDKKSQQRYAFLKPLIHLYKAFGELSQSNQVEAKKDYELYDEICADWNKQQENLSKKYNSLIIKAGDSFPQNCYQPLQEASNLIPNKPEPYLFLAFEKVQNKLHHNGSQQDLQIKQVIFDLDKAISHLPQLSNNHISVFYYYRAVCYLYKGDFNQAVSDVDKAIQKSEDNIPKYFYVRGLIFAIFGNFSQSIQDLSVAISLDDKYAKPYLERAKCLQIEGNSNQAFLDLQKYITLSPEDPYIHKYAGFLLFQNCAYDDCLAAFSHGSDEISNSEMLLTKAKCHFLLNNYEQSIQLLKKYEQQTHSTEYSNDLKLIKICMELYERAKCSQKSQQLLQELQQLIDNARNEDQEGRIFKIRDMHQLKASLYLILNQFEEAIGELEHSLREFREEKKREMEKQYVEDEEEFENQWSEVEIQFNIALAHIGLSKFDVARSILLQFDKSTQKGRNWDKLIRVLNDLLSGQLKPSDEIELDPFEQNHRISRNWPKIKVPGYQIYLSMAFSYPFVEPPEMLPEFDDSLLSEFAMKNVQKKPEAPWINRCEKGLVFTPNVQAFDQLQLSITTKKAGEEFDEAQKNKPISDIDRSVELSNSDLQLETKDLKQKLKLDPEIQMKLKRLIKKNKD